MPTHTHNTYIRTRTHTYPHEHAHISTYQQTVMTHMILKINSFSKKEIKSSLSVMRPDILSLPFTFYGPARDPFTSQKIKLSCKSALINITRNKCSTLNLPDAEMSFNMF